MGVPEPAAIKEDEVVVTIKSEADYCYSE